MRSGRTRTLPLVISSPILGVFAVAAAGPEPRRGHVICSGVFAVAAVTAAGVLLPGSPWLARRVRLRRPELTDQLPAGAGCCRAADASALEPGEVSVPGDRRGPDRPAPRRAGALRPAERRRGAGGRARHRAGTEAAGQRLGTVRRRDHHLQPGTASSAARSPAGRPSAGPPHRIRAPPDRDDAGHAPSLAVAAATCPRRRNTHLPGTIRRSLQITAVMRAWRSDH